MVHLSGDDVALPDGDDHPGARGRPARHGRARLRPLQQLGLHDPGPGQRRRAHRHLRRRLRHRLPHRPARSASAVFRCRSSRWDAFITPVAPAGAGQIHLNAATGAQLPHRRARGLSPLRGCGASARHQPVVARRARRMGSGSRRERDRRPRAEPRPNDGLRRFRVRRHASSIATATPGGCSSSISPSVSATATVKSVLDTSAATPALSGTQALSAVVQPLGTTLGKFFEDYTTARLTGNFTSELLAGVLPQTQGSIVVGSTSGAISPVTLAVNHLAVRYLDLAHGADTDTGPCYSASLALKVALPRRRRVDALLLREHEGRDRPAVHGLRQQRHVDGPVEHLRGQPARVRVATERDERRGARLHWTDVSSRSPERSRSTSRSPQARASRPQA